MIYIVLAILVIIVLAIAIHVWKGHAVFHRAIDNNTIIFGQKGSGKTTLCACASRHYDQVANKSVHRKKKKYMGYASNTDFGYPSGLVLNPGDITVAPNTWEDVLHGEVKPIKKNPNLEKKPVILDDAGIYLPNFADTMLKKDYPSLPISFAVWRHLYDAPIIINSQDIDRTWKMLREQQAVYIYARGVIKLPFVIGIRFTYYNRVEAARSMRNPMGSRFWNKYSKAECDKFKAENGDIVKGIYWIKTKTLHFDSRYFHNVFFQVPSPKKIKPRIFKSVKR